MGDAASPPPAATALPARSGAEPCAGETAVVCAGTAAGVRGARELHPGGAAKLGSWGLGGWGGREAAGRRGVPERERRRSSAV